MKRIIFMSVALFLVAPALAAAQTASSTIPLAEVARKEEQRQSQTKKPSKVFTNKDLKSDFSKPVAGAPSVASTAPESGNASAGNATPTAPSAPAAPAKDQAYWQGRIKTARDEAGRLQMFADALQSRINALTTDYVNRDDPAQREKVDADRKAALAELERVRKDIQAKTKEISAIEDEARRAGVPPGWLRPA